MQKLQWKEIRSILRQELIDNGIYSCELKWEGCTGQMYYTLAHSLRRVEIKSYDGEEYDEKLCEVIWACQPCHAKLDARKRIETYNIVTRTIQDRRTPINWKKCCELARNGGYEF